METAIFLHKGKKKPPAAKFYYSIKAQKCQTSPKTNSEMELMKVEEIMKIKKATVVKSTRILLKITTKNFPKTNPKKQF
jgi:hypothetical protein